MPEWSIGPHSKCGERVTVPRVRIPAFPPRTFYKGKKRINPAEHSLLQDFLFICYFSINTHKIYHSKMINKIVTLLVALTLCLSSAFAQTNNNSKTSVYSFNMKLLGGENISFDNYRGKVILIVNTASKCGFTPQYAGLEKLYQEYKDKGLIILGFPCNQFLGQEPGTAEEIKTSCLLHYGVTFPIFEKINVNGKNEVPLYTYLKAKAPFTGYPDKKTGEMLDNIHRQHNTGFAEGNNIRWNFTKFLISKDGEQIKRYESMVKPEEMEQAIEKLLGE